MSTDVKKLKSINIPLKRLKLSNSGSMHQTESKLLLFLSKFTETLEQLTLDSKIPDSAYEMIFEKFIKLKTLSTFISFMPTEGYILHNLRLNFSVQKLVVRGHHEGQDIKSLKGVIGNLPNVETLVLETGNVTKDLMTFISNNLRKLKNLELHQINANQFHKVRIESLKSLTIRNFRHVGWKYSDYQAMVGGLPNIEYFSVGGYRFDETKNCRLFYAISAGWPHLRHVKLHTICVDKELYELLVKCKELKTLEIDYESFYWSPCYFSPFDLKEAISKQTDIRLIIADD